LKIAESIQNWWKKWFYMKDVKLGDQKIVLAPFAPTKDVVKLKSWDRKLCAAKLKETGLLMCQICPLQYEKGQEVSGLHIMALFLHH
jgi:hypothetical protein